MPSPSNPRLLTSTIRPNFDPKMARLRCGMLDRSRRSCASPRGSAPLRGPTRRCARGDRARGHGNVARQWRSRDGPCCGPYRGTPWSKAMARPPRATARAGRRFAVADRFDLQSLRYRAARRDGGRGQSAADRCATAICACRDHRVALWQPGDHLARSRDPLGRSAAGDRRRAAKHDPVHLADQTGALVLSSGLHAPLGTRHRRRLLQCQF